MTASEWLRERFAVGDDGNFVAVQGGDFARYRVDAPGTGNSLALSTSESVFLSAFGPTIEGALASGASVAGALAGLENQRGFAPVFEVWKARGILT